jgi:hypothetical protein
MHHEEIAGSGGGLTFSFPVISSLVTDGVGNGMVAQGNLDATLGLDFGKPCIACGYTCMYDKKGVTADGGDSRICHMQSRVAGMDFLAPGTAWRV